MPLIPVSAVDVVSPAIERTKRLLFQPFRFTWWLRIAVIGFLTGEMSSGSFRANFPFPSSSNSGTHSDQFVATRIAEWVRRPEVIALLILGALLITVLILVFMYLGSVMRFVLMEAVITGQARIREGFRRWRETGTRFFLWTLFFQIIVASVFAVIAGTPLLLAWRLGVFHEPRAHLALLILGGLMLFFVVAALMIVALIVWVLAKDFVVPVMAFDNVGPVEGWRRLLAMMSARKGSYAAYIGMKAVLAMASAMLFGIIGIVLMLVILIPFGIVALMGYLAASGMGVGWNVFTITAAVVLGVIAFCALFFMGLMISVLPLVFFQSYVLLFFGSRYEPLATRMYPPPPPPEEPPSVPPPILPEPLPTLT